MSDKIEKTIAASVANGLTRPAIEAIIGRKFTDDELQLYRKTKAAYDIQLRKKRTERKYEHLNGTGRQQKYQDKHAKID